MGCKGCKVGLGRPGGGYSRSKEQPVQRWRVVDGMASSGRETLVVTGMSEGSSGHKARPKGPESDLGVGTLVLGGVGAVGGF